jgi:hypothetical protein
VEQRSPFGDADEKGVTSVVASSPPTLHLEERRNNDRIKA